MRLDGTFDFSEQLAMSTETNGRCFEAIISEMIPGVVSVVKTDVEQDKSGIDFIATLRRGAQIYIDSKKREKGVKKRWRGEEELALEIWSVKPTTQNPGGKPGWTLDEAKLTHYTLHVFDPSDSEKVFLLPFHLLRKAFRENLPSWKAIYFRSTQNSGNWKSECIFVPASVVIASINFAMVGTGNSASRTEAA